MSFYRGATNWAGRSLAVRWVLYVTLAAGLGISMLLGVAYHEMEYQLEAQGATVNTLARRKTAERIDAEIELAEYRLAMMNQTLERNLTGVTLLRSTLAAITRANDVMIAADIGQRLVKSGFSGAIVLDQHLNIIGADRTGVELVAASDALRLHPLFQDLSQFMAAVTPGAPAAFRYIGPFDASYAAILLAPLQDQYGTVLAVPVLDDFGEPIALIVGYRTIQWHEPSLVEFAGITKSKIALMLENRTISVTSPDMEQVQFGAPGPEGLLAVPELQASARCRTSFRQLVICAIQSDVEIARLSAEIMAIGREQFSKTRNTLSMLGLISLALIMGLLIMLVHRLTRPLLEITQSIDLVARGEWRVEVKHTERLDEIGRIARAISAMQISLAERDRMRQEMVRIDAINQRRLVLENAVARFEDGMAVVTKSIADTMHTLGASNDVLDKAARQADQQAEKIRNASVVTATKATRVSHTTLELSQTIREIAGRIRSTGADVTQSEAHARAAQLKLGEVSMVAGEVEDAIATLQGFVADLGHLSLKASLEAMESGEAGHRFSPMAQSVSTLAIKAGEVTTVLSRELARLGVVAEGASEEIGEIKGVLGHALRETREIAVVVEEQDAATREIAAGLANSAGALTELADAVDHLRANMASAHEASADFVLTARRIAEDAKSIDGSVRKFVRDVVA
jgi:methyl-accepting chemotaxis protein